MRACPSCGFPKKARGRCQVCWGREIGAARRRYHFTAELVDELKLAYAGNRDELGAALARLERRTGWPREVFYREARRREITGRGRRRFWTAQETAYVAERIGVVSIKRIAEKLRRSVEAVEAHAERMHISRRVREGYCQSDLAQVMGVTETKVARWMERGLLGRVRTMGGRRVGEEAVVRFLRRHHGEYDLRRVDQTWYKSQLFGAGREV